MIVCDDLVVDALEESLRLEGTVSVRLWGRSMLPLFWPGARHVIEACDPCDVSIGDVVVLRRGVGVTAHRVVARRGGQLVVKGDRFPRPDARPAELDAVLGRVTSVPFGPRALPLGSALGCRVNRLLGSLTLAAQPSVERSMRWGRGLQTELLRRTAGIRRRTLAWRVERLGPAHLPRMREALLRRGVRAERRDLQRWEQLATSEGLPFAMVALGGEGRVVGWMRASGEPEGGAGLYDLWVERFYRRIGVASALLAEAEAWLVTLKIREVTIDTSGARDDTPRLFASRGFAATARPSVGPGHRRYARALEP